MKTFDEIRRMYHSRQRDTVVDAISASLTYVDEIVVETGLLEEVGLWSELTDSVCTALPFALIAVTEGTKALLGRKPAANSLRDAAARMAKTGAALGVGSLVASQAGFLAAIPVTMGVRALLDHCRTQAMTGARVQGRIERLREINAALRSSEPAAKEQVYLEETTLIPLSE